MNVDRFVLLSLQIFPAVENTYSELEEAAENFNVLLAKRASLR